MDLSDLGLSPSEERTETVEQFHAHATSVFGNPFTTEVTCYDESLE